MMGEGREKGKRTAGSDRTPHFLLIWQLIHRISFFLSKCSVHQVTLLVVSHCSRSVPQLIFYLMGIDTYQVSD